MLEVAAALLEELAGVADILTYSFDLELLPNPRSATWFEVPSAESWIFGSDATGGAYATCLSRGAARSFHVDAVGEVSLLGGTTADTISRVVALPYWRDLRALCRSQPLERCYAAARDLEADVVADLPDLGAARAWLWQKTSLAPPTDAVAELHTLASAPRLPLVCRNPVRLVEHSGSFMHL